MARGIALNPIEKSRKVSFALKGHSVLQETREILRQSALEQWNRQGRKHSLEYYIGELPLCDECCKSIESKFVLKW